MCGIIVFSDNTHIIFNTTIIVTYGENPNDMIRREEYDYYNVMCLMNRTVDGKLSGNKVDVTMRKDGKAARSKYILLHLIAKISKAKSYYFYLNVYSQSIFSKTF